ncbi:MAG: alpha/beta fold hydrolase [Candidatus Phaeomarinobacter sp.]
MNPLLRGTAVAVAGVALMSSSHAQEDEPASSGPLTPAPCEELIGYDHRRVTCGFLSVKETPTGRDLDLAVAVIAAVDGSEGKEPVIFAHGGPGGAVVGAAHQFAKHPMNLTRDVILFDQRGSGASRPLDCPDSAATYLQMLAADLDERASTQVQANIETVCRDQMINDGADLDGYGTRETVGDMEVLREALGVETWNVMGVSYGTTVGLDYVRMHPERTRALVMDSVYPPSFAPGGDAATRSFVRALEQLYADCRSDGACKRAFPGLETSYLATLIALGREPLAIPVADRSLVPSGVFYLNPQDFTSIIHQMLYSDTTLSLVPKVIDLAARGQGEALAGLVNILGPLALRIDMVARLSVECRERWLVPGRTLTDMNRLERFLRRSLTIFDTEDILCEDWAPQFSDADFNIPVSSPVPALFYSGANDPITPPENTLSTFRRFPAGQYVHVPYTGHGVDRSHLCAREITAAFLDEPRTLVRDGCVSNVTPVPFVTDVALSRGVLPFASGILQLQTPFLLVCLGMGGLLVVIGMIWLLTAVSRSSHGRRPSAVALASAGFSGLSGLTLLVFAAVLTLTIADTGAGLTPAMLALGVPADSGWLLALPLVALGAFGLGTVLLLLAMARGGANTKANMPLLVLCIGCGLALAVLWWQGFIAPVG